MEQDFCQTAVEAPGVVGSVSVPLDLWEKIKAELASYAVSYHRDDDGLGVYVCVLCMAEGDGELSSRAEVPHEPTCILSDARVTAPALPQAGGELETLTPAKPETQEG